MEADWEVEIGGDSPAIEPFWPGLVDLRAQPERVGELAEIPALPALASALVRLNGPGSQVWTAKCDVWETTEFAPVELDAVDSSPNAGQDSGKGDAGFALACYIDLIPVRDPAWGRAILPQNLSQNLYQPGSGHPAMAHIDSAVAWCKAVCNRLRGDPARNCRLDLVIRAIVVPERVVQTAVLQRRIHRDGSLPTAVEPDVPADAHTVQPNQQGDSWEGHCGVTAYLTACGDCPAAAKAALTAALRAFVAAICVVAADSTLE